MRGLPEVMGELPVATLAEDILTTGEDRDLWRRLAPHGGMLASVRLSVTTASRLIGRAPAGFAANLHALTLTAEPAI